MAYHVETVCDRSSLRDFLRLPFVVYANDTHWVAPINAAVRRVLDKRRNPYFAQSSVDLLVCYRGVAPVARAAIIINRAHWQKFDDRAAFFGYFESLDDTAATRLLFSHAEEYCRARGAECLEGPFNPNHYSELGLQASKFGTPPAFFQPYNPPYYMRLLQDAGFTVTHTFHTRKNARIGEYIRQHFGEKFLAPVPAGYTVRCFRMDDFDAELERMRQVFNDAFAHHWHFLFLSREEYRFAAKFLRLVTYPELITLVERRGEPVGVLQCVLDINPLLRRWHGTAGPIKYLRYQRHRRRLRHLIIYAAGIKKAYQRTRVHKLLFDALCRIAVRYDVLETTWMSEDQPLAIRAVEHFGLERDKDFVIYQKSLTRT
jgi:hypothetical protein